MAVFRAKWKDGVTIRVTQIVVTDGRKQPVAYIDLAMPEDAVQADREAVVAAVWHAIADMSGEDVNAFSQNEES